MTTYEPDSDVVQWGLNILDGHPLSSSSYHDSLESGVPLYDVHYMSNRFGTLYSDIENDEILAHTLQEEELSQLTVNETSEYSHSCEDHVQTSTLTHDWLCPPVDQLCPDQVYECQPDVVDMDPSSSSSSPERKSYEEAFPFSLELTDEFSILDGEVGKRLNEMASIPHVPRINGEIPSVNEAMSDHERLLDRLLIYELVELKVQGDGNCQFRALSDQFYRTPEHHKFVRQQIINQLNSHSDIYEGYVSMAYSDYLDKMSRDGEWGDHVTLQAAADSYGVKVFVITSFKDTCYIEILPAELKSNRIIFLSFWAEVHYNSIYPMGESPSSERRRRKWWRRRRLCHQNQ